LAGPDACEADGGSFLFLPPGWATVELADGIILYAGEAVLTADQRAVAAALLADVTSADLALTPFTVMRAVSPDLQPISFGHGLDRALTRTLAKRAVSLPEAWISPIW